MQIKHMAIEQLQNLIRKLVDKIIDKYFGDPDEGNKVKELFKQGVL